MQEKSEGFFALSLFIIEILLLGFCKKSTKQFRAWDEILDKQYLFLDHV